MGRQRSNEDHILTLPNDSVPKQNASRDAIIFDIARELTTFLPSSRLSCEQDYTFLALISLVGLFGYVICSLAATVGESI